MAFALRISVGRQLVLHLLPNSSRNDGFMLAGIDTPLMGNLAQTEPILKQRVRIQIRPRDCPARVGHTARTAPSRLMRTLLLMPRALSSARRLVTQPSSSLGARAKAGVVAMFPYHG
jgi:hypothetical protein